MDNTIPFNRNGQLYLPLDLPIILKGSDIVQVC